MEDPVSHVGPEAVATVVNAPFVLPSHQPGMIAQLQLLRPPDKGQSQLLQSTQSVPTYSEQTVEEPKGPRPVRSIPIAGTPWSVVWSSDNRQFFFNAANRSSVWNIPKDLESNPLIHKILDETTEGKSELK